MHRLSALLKPDDVFSKSILREKIITLHSSSLGRLNPRYLGMFYACVSDSEIKELNDHFKIIFPTDDYVKSSYLGTEHANSLFLNSEYWEHQADFPRECFYRLENT